MELHFGQYRLKPAERQVLGPKGALDVSARSFDLLALLLGRPDEVIRKAELFDAAWPGLVVEENTLQVHISALRKVLGAGMIMTVHGQGYKYTGPRPLVDGDASAATDAEPHATVFLSGARTAPVTGGRLCGEVRYRITQPPTETMICHCRMCQKFSGSAFTIGSVYATDAVIFTKGALKYFKSSPFAERGFCATCGSSMSYRPLEPAVSKEWEGWILIECGSLDNPAASVPTWELGVESQMPWLDIRLGHRRVRCQDAPDLVEAWAAYDLPVP